MTNRKRSTNFIMHFASKLRFPQLFLMALSLWLIDMLIPDLVPFVDEILLGLVTLLLASWKKKREENSESRRFERAKRVNPLDD